MNLGSIQPQADASMTIATAGRARRTARSPFEAVAAPPAPRIEPARAAVPANATPIFVASGAPAAPAAPSSAALSFAARMNVVGA